MHPFVLSRLSSEQKQEFRKVIVYLMRSKEIKEQSIKILQMLAADSKEELVHK